MCTGTGKGFSPGGVRAFSPGYGTGAKVSKLNVSPLVSVPRAGTKGPPLVPVGKNNRD